MVPAPDEPPLEPPDDDPDPELPPEDAPLDDPPLDDPPLDDPPLEDPLPEDAPLDEPPLEVPWEDEPPLLPLTTVDEMGRDTMVPLTTGPVVRDEFAVLEDVDAANELAEVDELIAVLDAELSPPQPDSHAADSNTANNSNFARARKEFMSLASMLCASHCA